MKAINVADIVTESGKTFKELNLEKQHSFKVNDLVEIKELHNERSQFKGMRLYIIGCTRDCDGTPLYVLGSKGMELYQDANKHFYNFNSFSGFSEESLTLINKHHGTF